MPSATYYTAAHGDLEFTLCHRSPHWEFTVHNREARTLWIDGLTSVPAGGTYTISTRTRTPTYRLSVADKPNVWHYTPTALNLTVDAMRVAITHGLESPATATFADFIEVPVRKWRVRMIELPLVVSVYGTPRGTCTAVQYQNIAVDSTYILDLDGHPLLPGETLTVKGARWRPFSRLHDVRITTPAGRAFWCEPHVYRGDVAIYVRPRVAPLARAPAAKL